MEAGQLNKRVILQSPTIANSGDYAEPTATWADTATVWAAIEPLSGREYFASRQTQDILSVRVRIRYYSGLSPKWRVKFGTRTFHVESVINLKEANVEMHLMCRELVNG